MLLLVSPYMRSYYTGATVFLYLIHLYSERTKKISLVPLETVFVEKLVSWREFFCAFSNFYEKLFVMEQTISKFFCVVTFLFVKYKK